MIPPNAAETSPSSISSSARPPLSGRKNAPSRTSSAPAARAQAAIAERSACADRPGQASTTTATATPSRPSTTSHARRLRPIGASNAPITVVTPATSANAPTSAISAVRPIPGQASAITPNAIPARPRSAIAFQMRARTCSPSFSFASRFIGFISSPQLRGKLVDLPLELLAGCRETRRLLAPRVARRRLQLAELLADCDASRAELGERGLGALAAVAGPRRGLHLEPLDVRVPAVQLVRDGGGELGAALGGVGCERPSCDVDPGLQPGELVLDLVGRVADGRPRGRLLLLQRVEVALEARFRIGCSRAHALLQPLDLPADPRQPILDRRCRHHL